MEKSLMLQVEWIGQTQYMAAWNLQKKLVAERAANPELPDKLLLLEHPPTYTLGRSGHLEHILLDENTLKEKGFELYWVDRGGDVTYHGPGQLVGYPILNLRRLHGARGYDRPDLHLYLRELEEVIIQALAVLGVEGFRYPGYTGVWVETAVGPQKIAAIGVKVNSRGITSHGFALNVNPNMIHFGYIVPCGIQEHGVISLAELLKRPFSVTDLISPIVHAFGQVFQVELPPVSTYNLPG
ncbi:MAG: lipoyl(octanoyl) transferase LipB [Chloroflexi bacterium]|nr:MAG: lipoyl(octanoyl) transferase LipB [Chloroflexota bacterium]